ncbi:methyl-accepting chemotaxis protein [Azospirillum brasilense]|uniref:Methyl-accepting chemotaxis protein n=1 Tax=Azospirillum brasilense TaxID=192 RepID=A0A560B3G1_AZOBR|nr:methyl-accepting chemotaxis protein [Azospirillum brasilense]TWA67177.1 methyl-accepting chemotaxis protein [Azospirillum brasilense]
MSMLSSMTIRTKVVAATVSVLLMSVALGLFAVDRLSTVNHAAEEIRSNWLPSVTAIGEIDGAANDYRILEASHILALYPAEMAEVEKEMTTVLNRLTEARRKYEPLLAPGWETQTFKRWEAAWDGYLKISQGKLLPPSRANENEKATGIYRDESRKAFDECSALVNDLTGSNVANATKAADSGRATYVGAQSWILGAIAFVAVLCLFAGIAMTKSVARPIVALTAIMDRLAKRDLVVAVEGGDRQDEIGAMARAVQVFKDGLIEAERLTAAQAAEEENKRRRTERIDSLIRNFDGAVHSVLQTVGAAASQLDTTARSMTDIAEHTRAEAGSAASAAELTSANVQTVAAASEEMAASITEISQQVSQSAGIAGKAVDEADRTNATVQGLSEAAQRIGDVVDLIQNIAAQTNLLALNATIEAARAGEAGKGFAVVASEVKSLANQTSKATEEIAQQIGAIQAATGGAVGAIRGIGATISSINDISSSIAAAIEEQGAATQEISRSVQQAAQSTQEVTSNIGRVSQAATETGSAATQVMSASGDLNQGAMRLKSEVENFLVAIKAA